MSRGALHAAIEAALETHPDLPVAIGLSGGVDSSALLLACAELPAMRARGLRALHVDHGWHADSAQWAEHCQAQCARIGITCETTRVDATPRRGEGLEAAARRVRYDWFETQLQSGGLLLLAHHQDDAVETALLRMLRGAGPASLGMPAERALGRGTLIRPWLQHSRVEIETFARERGIEWIEDPSNLDARHARNFVRHQVLPLLRGRWPGTDAALLRSTRLAREAAEVAAAEARRALAQLQTLDPAALRLDGFCALRDELRQPVLREWLESLGLPLPPASLDEPVAGIGPVRSDAQTRIGWAGAELRIWAGLLWAMPHPVAEPPDHWSTFWDGRQPLDLPAGCGRLELDPPPQAPLDFEIRLRRGGERLRVHAAGPTRELRTLLQEQGIPPWLRPRLPLLFRAGEMVAVADLIVGHALRERLDQDQTTLRWTR